jgi:hypothetical protein
MSYSSVFPHVMVNAQCSGVLGTESRIRVVNTPASFSEGSRIKSWSGDPPSLQRFSVAFFSPFRRMPDTTLNVATAASFQILSNSSFAYRPFLLRYTVLVIKKASLNKIQIIEHSIFYVTSIFPQNALNYVEDNFHFYMMP